MKTPTQEKHVEGSAQNGANLDTSFALKLRVPEDPAERERMAVLLYDLRAVSQGNAARIAGLTRAAFFDALGRHGVTPFQYDDEEEALADVQAARL